MKKMIKLYKVNSSFKNESAGKEDKCLRKLNF